MDDAADRRGLSQHPPKEIFEGQYQQNPQFGGSGICSIDRLARYHEASHYELLIHCWDLAGTKNGGDWTVCAKFGLTRDEKGREILDLIGHHCDQDRVARCT